ncbi:vacuolar protein sorting-associated protein 55 homolog isoform X1 [Cicer arietinum]|uniref:Vacuolar protein sorting-associated protein 55 homolog isoform X1 n=1 Tax=Cicer arietinum TaxID=3827 RepID=A0A1S2YS16_CICAR|nr:vacuolar protein sorting-associated protein 55 homolog isoform X1 [Cicer arietinum]
MAELPGYVRYCLHTCKLVLLAILVSGGIVLQILLHICSMWQACSLFNNWWPMLTAITYVLLPMPLLFFAGSESSLFSDSDSRWVNATKFLTGASAVGSIAIPAILKHSDVIGWGALAMELSSFFVFVLAIMCYIKMSDEDGYSSIL